MTGRAAASRSRRKSREVLVRGRKNAKIAAAVCTLLIGKSLSLRPRPVCGMHSAPRQIDRSLPSGSCPCFHSHWRSGGRQQQRPARERGQPDSRPKCQGLAALYGYGLPGGHGTMWQSGFPFPFLCQQSCPRPATTTSSNGLSLISPSSVLSC